MIYVLGFEIDATVYDVAINEKMTVRDARDTALVIAGEPLFNRNRHWEVINPDTGGLIDPELPAQSLVAQNRRVVKLRLRVQT